MAAVQFPKDYLTSSTPIQPIGRGRNSKRFLSSPAKEFDALSPIKANSKSILFQNLNSLEKNCDTTFVLTRLRRNKILEGVSRKLKFTELSNLIDVNNSNNDNDSGFGSESDLSKSENHSTSIKSLDHSTDDNCNIIHNQDDNSSINFTVSELLISDSKDSKSEVLDNRIKSCPRFDQQSQIPRLNIVRELNLRNCYGVLKLILSYLPDDDVQKASCVNSEWRNIIANDRAASKRRKEYLKSRKTKANGPEKENRSSTKTVIERRHKPLHLKDINSEIVVEQPLTFTQTVGKFDSFIQEAENLALDEMLTKCPKCLYPSRVQSGDQNVCSRQLCQHEFCRYCMGPYFDNHACASSKPCAISLEVIIGSKQSRKNLKRL